jgi:hypothetical protein
VVPFYPHEKKKALPKKIGKLSVEGFQTQQDPLLLFGSDKALLTSVETSEVNQFIMSSV